MDRIELYNILANREPKSSRNIYADFEEDTSLVITERDYGFNTNICFVEHSEGKRDCTELGLIKHRFIEESDTLCISIDSSINGAPLVHLESTIRDLIHGVLGRVSSNILTVDLTQADLSNVIFADRMFSQIEHKYKLNIIMPKGDKALRPVSASKMFADSNFLDLGDALKSIDFSNVTVAEGMFGWSVVDSIDLSSANFGNLLLAHRMFHLSCAKTIELPKIGISRVADISKMFNGCVYIKEIDISGIDGESVTLAYGMFENCYKLETIKADWGRVFSEIEAEDAFYDMFHDVRKLKNIDIMGFIQAVTLKIRGIHTDKYSYLSSEFLFCDKLRWYKEYTPIVLDSKCNYKAVNLLVSGITCEFLDISGIRIGDLPLLFCEFRNGIESYPDTLIIDSSQYQAERNVYESFRDCGMSIVEIEYSELEVTVSKVKAFRQPGSKYVIVVK